MKKHKTINYFKTIFIILVLIFMSLFIALESGYYDAKTREKIVLTNEMIEEFEKDLEVGNPVDIKKYVVEDSRDYSNKASKAGMKLSLGVERFMTSGIKTTFEFLGKIFT